MRRVRVLVVDDSSFAREVITGLLSDDVEISVIGEAANGKEALERVKDLKPDLVTMDITMPVMDGLEAIEKIMAFHAVPILVVTSSQDATIAFKAISKGALEVVAKPDIDDNAQGLCRKVKLLSQVKVISHIGGRYSGANETPPKPRGKSKEPSGVVAIASSTGGPKALSVLLSALPADFPLPVLIAQHMCDGFISGMVRWLNDSCKLEVKTGESGERIVPGTVYLSPSESHMVVTRERRIAMKARGPNTIYSPSCNALLSSVADAYGTGSIGVILTGMGDDGVLGMKRIKGAGGMTLAQDEKTCVVFGMPKVAIESGCIDRIVPIHEMSAEILNLVKRSAVFHDSSD